MGHAVFIQNPTSNYNDRPGETYHFPRQYLGSVQSTVGDWVILYEGKKGAFGYTSVQKILGIRPDPDLPDHYYADVEPGSLFQFETLVPRQSPDGLAYELSLRGPDGRPSSGGANVSAVRKISPAEFSQIVNAGLREVRDESAIPRLGEFTQENPDVLYAQEEAAPFEHMPLDVTRESVLTSRIVRDAAFARIVKRAYGNRCAISGMELRNGGGRAEVEAAHIKPVKNGGPDIVHNGLALSGTIHWMFDRGLITIADDYSIIVSHNKVPSDAADRLIRAERRLILPERKRDYPHPAFLQYHREHVFGAIE